MSSSRRRFVVSHPVVVDIGCGCRRPKLSSFFSSSLPKFRLSKSSDPFSPSTTTTTVSTNSLWDTSLTATTASSPMTLSPSLPPYSAAESTKRRPKKKTVKAKKKGVVEESVVVVKESSDPYLDFRDSMLQMIVEMEIYAWDDLRDLLHRFLALNSPSHHHLILQAFFEIWTGVFSAPPSSSAAAAAASSRRPSRRRR
ncbi:transcription repressor OFP8-like [Phoenix dactylifera]|uniref:Transcription repressor n=1 Tax=Phoenix dactylifera TaxID=42345 RepID=A0A8B7CIB9_PHODC|nr:transcription repressor OFP8-like [Phoenix dactylifera]